MEAKRGTAKEEKEDGDDDEDDEEEFFCPLGRTSSWNHSEVEQEHREVGRTGERSSAFEEEIERDEDSMAEWVGSPPCPWLLWSCGCGNEKRRVMIKKTRKWMYKKQIR
ncbi:hypothetical protein AXF42_Ash015953 [Apostasia shenzhenica]|uniref:Uncharacterized protein n=1 Tax=Apostasia shenzhenica TaxID=1088818 RepID=A0A2I0AWG9_9ASPA|nr:hypothetical protein AXF42_Ash015953 [Apostasia shenzhenica]